MKQDTTQNRNRGRSQGAPPERKSGEGSVIRIVRAIIILQWVTIISLLNYLAIISWLNPATKAWLIANYGVLSILLDPLVGISMTVLGIGIIALVLLSKPKGSLRKLVAYLRPHWPYVVAIAIAMIITSALDLAQPWFIGYLLVGNVIVQRNLGFLPVVIGLIAGAFALNQVTSFIQDYLTQTLGSKTVHGLRTQVYSHIQHLPMQVLDQSRSGELISRVMSDTKEVEGVLTSDMSNLGSDFAMVILAVVLLFYASLKIAMTIVPFLIGVVIVVNLFKRRIKRGSRRIRQTVGDLSARAFEVISGIRIVKSFVMEKRESEDFRDRSLAIAKSEIRLARLSSVYDTLVDTVTTLAMVVLILVAVPDVLVGALTLGALVALLGVLNKLFKPLVSLSKSNFKIEQAVVSAERLFEITETPAEVLDAPGAFALPALHGKIEFDNVSFDYNRERRVLRDVSLTIQPGETVAIVGQSGVGKSTIVGLLLRFYPPTSGTIRIDGYPIDTLKLDFLRKNIGLVIQDPILFSGNVRDNIAYGKPGATQQEVVQAAKAANAHEFIINLPAGYDTEIGERGVTLSVGQRQRISIARALIKDPKILILDEATSNVDAESESLIQETMGRMSGQRTTVVIAHRLSTILDADRIIVLEDGEIAEAGRHHSLLQRHGAYARLYETQVQALAGALPQQRNSVKYGPEDKST